MTVGLLFGLCGSQLLLAPAGATTSAATSPLKQGLAFYQGQTITFISPGAPGGGFDTWARTLAPAMASYLHANINVEDIPAGDTVAGQDTLAHSAPDGLTIGFLSTGIDVQVALSGEPGLNFNPEREAFIGSTLPQYSGFMSGTQSGCPTSIEQLIDNSKAGHPTSILLETVGVTLMFSKLFDVAFNLHLNLVPGYTSTANIVQGFQRGDGCLVDSNLASLESLLAAGKAKTLVALGKPVKGLYGASYIAAAPTLQAVINKYGSEFTTKQEKAAQTALLQLTNASGDQLAVPSKVATDKIDALRAAMEAAMKNPTLISKALSVGLTPGYIPGSDAKQQYIQGLNQGKPVAADLSA